MIASTAEIAKNSLAADHLTFSDVDNFSNAKSSGFGIALGPTGISLPVVAQPAEEKEKGKALATLTPGALNLASQSQDLASLNTDLSRANTQVKPFDIERLKARQQSAAALSELLNMGVGELAQTLELPEGSLIKTILHGVAGALVSLAAGGNVATGALAGAASELANGMLQQALAADPNLSDAQKSAITQWLAAAVGTTVGGQAGAAAALDYVNYNFLTHKQRDELAAALKACEGQGNDAACKAEVSKTYYNLDFAQEAQLDACRTTDCLKGVLGDLYGHAQIAYNDVTALQELGVSEVLAQRLLAYQVQERWLTGDASQFEQRIADVAAGIGYCEASGNADGCFVKGQLLKYTSQAVNELVYMMLGMHKGTSVRDGTGKDLVPVVPEGVPYFRVQCGGLGNATSRNALTVNAAGSVSITPGCTGSICVSVSNSDHAAYHLSNKRPDGTVLVFEVDRATHNKIMDAAVDQFGNRGAGVKITDKGTPGTSIELNQAYSELMLSGSSKGRVVNQKEFLDEFGGD